MPHDSATTPLTRIGILSGFDSDELTQFSRFGKAIEFASREFIVQQGESRNCFFIILKGKARVYLRSTAGIETTLAELGPGESLGDMNFLDGQPAIATAQAFGGATLWCMTREEFDRYSKNHPQGAIKLTHEIAATIVRRLRRAVLQISDDGQAVGEGWW